jgi:UDP-sugar transporter A1/2/3
MESIQTNILDRPKDALKILVPALLYLVQNSLLYVALSNLTAPVFQVTYQTKLVTTAIVSVGMLNRKYTLQQWICLVTLSLGVAIVVLGESSTGSASSSSTQASAEAPAQSLVVGLMAVSVACVSSALAGVYFEKVVKTVGSEKHKPVSVWMRNIQLAFFTICTAFAQGLWTSMHEETTSAQVTKDYFHGFTGLVWVLVALQAGGGLLVAAVIKYADNVLKGLATGVSVCFATAFSSVFFGTPMTTQFTVGATAILISVYLFSNPMTKAQITGAGGGISTSPMSGSSSSSGKEMRPLLPSYEKD